jgi:CBS domain containing-hemolysin-like protein
MWELVLSVALAVGISAFCSVSEAVFYSFSWSRIEQLRRSGKKSGEILYKLRLDVEKPISAILTLNTVAHTAGASIAGAAWASVFGHETLGWFVVAFTIVILIFSEIWPKTIGVVYNRQLASLLAQPIWLMVKVLSPIIYICGLFSRFIGGGKRGPDTTEDDIRALASLTRKAGVIKPYEETSIRNILSLDQKTVEEIMTPRTVVFSLPAAMTVDEARRGHPIWPHSRIPVYEGDDPEDVVGVVHRRKVFESLANDQDELKLADIMVPVKFVPENLALDKLLVKFLGARMHFYVVLDEYGGVAGVVTLEDVLEEILGREIVDETDQVADMRAFARQQREALIKNMNGESSLEPEASAKER